MDTKLCKHCQTTIPKKAKVCPQCRKKQGGKLKWIVIAVIAILIIGSAAGGGNKEKPKESEQPKQQERASVEKQSSATEKGEETESKQEEKAEISYTQFTVAQMMDDLKSNALKAESAYKDQYVEITGRLATIDSSGKYISLLPEDDEWAIIGVQCYIKNDDQKEKVMEMTTGDTITLKGKVISVGEVLGYGLNIDEFN